MIATLLRPTATTPDMFELGKNKEPADDLEKQIELSRRRSLIVAFLTLAWFVGGLIFMNAGLADAKTKGILRILFSLYLITFIFSPLVAVVAFLFAAYARRRVETRAETMRLREEQRSQETFDTGWGVESATFKIRAAIKNLTGRSRQVKLHCQKCGVELKRRSELQGQKIGGVFMGSELEKFLDLMLSCAYKCRNCGYLKCQSCVRVGGGCPSCTKMVFDVVN